MSDAWTLLVEIFDTRAAGQSDRVAVFAGPLGSGKTLGAITYTAMMRSDAGALIVTRRIAQAVEVGRDQRHMEQPGRARRLARGCRLSSDL